MPPMTPRQTRRFLAYGTRTGKLATVRSDGRAHVTPIWFVVDGDDLVFTTAAASVKGRNLQRDPRATIAVDDQTPPYSYVMAEGTTHLSTDLDELLRWATQIGARYMGDHRSGEYGERNGVDGELLVRFTPSKVVAEERVAE
jgi:PPOX class probable F420-dependent enzyme